MNNTHHYTPFNSLGNVNTQHNALIKIAYWNAAGIGNKLLELEAFMYKYSIDIMMILETKIPPITTQTTGNTPYSLSIRGYYTYLSPHPLSHRRGGVATLVKHGIKHSVLQPIGLPSLQSAPIALTINNNNTTHNIIIAPIYCPPQHSWNKFHFLKLFKYFDSLIKDSSFILCGDWNAKHPWWGNTRSCLRGRAIMDCIHKQARYNILATGGATHFAYDRRKKPSALDFAVYGGLNKQFIRTRSTIDLDSDHLPIHVDLTTNGPLANESMGLKRRLLPKNANLTKFQHHLNQRVLLNTEIKSGPDIEDAIDILLENIRVAAKLATPPTCTSQRRHFYNKSSRFELSKNVKKLLQLKRIYKRKLITLNNQHTKMQYKSVQNRLKKALRKSNSDQINKLFNHIDTSDRYKMQKLWHITKNYKRQPEPNWPLKINTPTNQGNTNSHRWTRSSNEKAELFASHLQQRFSPILTNSDEFQMKIANELSQQIINLSSNSDSLINTLPFRPVTVSETIAEIKSLTLNKSPGPDDIDNYLIKAMPQKAVTYLVLIFNSILRFGHFPRQWKLATITMILKPGKSANEVTSYRPISLLAGFSKIFERLLLYRLFECKDFADAIPTHQFGFRKEHGTEQQLRRVTQFILKAYENRCFCSAVFIDISEAFDRVWHPGLLWKLIKLLPIKLFNVLSSYLLNRTFTVRCNDGTTSKLGNLRAGVPQGSVLGPVLYTIYSSDMPLPTLTTHFLPSRPVDGTYVLISTYADDTIILSSAITPHEAVKLNQRNLNNIINWATRWCISINSQKTAHVMYTTRKLEGTFSTLSPKINGQSILNKSCHQYLGFHMDYKLLCISHITQLCNKLRATYKKLEWLLGPSSKLSRSCKVVIFKQMIIPLWQYILPIYGSLASTTQLSRVEVMHNTILRRIVKATRFTRNQSIRDHYNIKSFFETYHLASKRFASSLLNHPNSEARKLILTPFIPTRLKRPRYLEQIHQHFALPTTPRQQQQNQLAQNEQLPTLLRIQKEEEEKLNKANQPHRYIPTLPQNRFDERAINALRRRYKEGLTTLDRLRELVQYQPVAIQRLILPEPSQVPHPAPQDTQNPQLQQPQAPLDDEQILIIRLQELQLNLVRELDEAMEIEQQQLHSQQ